MKTRSKLAMATVFVGLVATAATAFGQTGSPSGEPSSDATTEERPRRAAAARRDGDRCGRPRPRVARRIVHSDSKVKTQEGFAVVTVDAGQITAIDHGDKTVTIKRLDGETVTATATDETKICKDGKAVAFDSLKTGDNARLVSVRSEEFTGLRRIGAITPGSETDQARARRARPAAEFPADDMGDILDPVA